LLYNQLTEGLKGLGFILESREYKPHLTLGRQVVLPKDFDLAAFSRSIKPITISVKAFSLM
jgi:2'-5' RNA ligase